MLPRFALPAALGILAALGLACQQGVESGASAPDAPQAASGGDAEVAAEIDGVAITVAELDEFIKEALFQSRAASPAKLHELRESTLQQMIQERVFSAEAERRGLDTQELLAEQAAALGAVTDDEIATWYEENKERLGNAELAQVAPRIRSYLESQREQQASEALLENAKVVVYLEPPRFEVSAEGPSKGPSDATVTIVEFSDFQCPYCRRAVPTLQQVLEKYPDQVRVVYRHLPLSSHPRARPAAEASLCADDQDQFWAYHDKLFENARKLEDADLVRYAGELGLDEAAFAECFEGNKHSSAVSKDAAAARSAGITGTPAFVVNGVLISGAKPAADFFRIIDAELERQKQGEG